MTHRVNADGTITILDDAGKELGTINLAGGGAVAASFQNALTRVNGDAMALAAQLYNDNHTLRERQRLPEGSVVLSKDEVTTWEAFQKTGVKPEDVTKLTTERDAALADKTKLERSAALDTVIAAGGFKPEAKAALERLVRDETFEVRETGEGDAKKKEIFVKFKDAAGQATEAAIDKYEPLAAVLPAFKAEQAAGGQQQQQTITPYVPQGGGASGGGKANQAQAYLDKKYGTPPNGAAK